MALPEQLVALLRKPAVCYVSTTMPEGSPQITQTWVGTDGEHVVINIVQGMQKARNLERDPGLALVVSDPQAPSPVLPGTRPRCDRCWWGGLDRGPVVQVHRRPLCLVRGPRPSTAGGDDRGPARQRRALAAGPPRAASDGLVRASGTAPRQSWLARPLPRGALGPTLPARRAAYTRRGAIAVRTSAMCP
jgi:hypothetical protein